MAGPGLMLLLRGAALARRLGLGPVIDRVRPTVLKRVRRGEADVGGIVLEAETVEDRMYYGPSAGRPRGLHGRVVRALCRAGLGGGRRGRQRRLLHPTRRAARGTGGGGVLVRARRAERAAPAGQRRAQRRRGRGDRGPAGAAGSRASGAPTRSSITSRAPAC